jgi:citrate synthase
MDECLPVMNTGLRGVAVASSKICDVRGKEGKLIYRGFLIEDLAGNATFEEVCFLLLYERLPKRQELEDFQKSLKQKRKVPENVFSFLKTLPADMNPMDVLQMATPLLIQTDQNAGKPGIENTLYSVENLISGLAIITAAWDRIRNKREVIPPDNDLSHAANFLYMLNGEIPDDETARFFDTSLVRANVRVMEMLKEIGSVDKINAYIDNILNSGGLIMGLGHAVYQTDDPRAIILAPMSRRMGQIVNQPLWYELSRELEKKAKAAFKAKKQREIFCNVDFYSASLFHAMGIAMDFFTPVFAVSRVSGWSAHVIEEQFAMAAPKPTLYRPGAEYVGDYCGPDECLFTDMDER